MPNKTDKGRKPDWVLKVLDRSTEDRARVGSGWTNVNGSISIRLNPCITLKPEANIVITLFPSQFIGE